MKVFGSRKKRDEFIALTVGLTILFALAYVYFRPYIGVFSRPEELRALVKSFGILGPLIVVGMQFTQVLLAPLPPVVPVISGYVFGSVEGTLYSVIGAFIGSALAIYISRVYGRSLVDYFVKDEVFSKFQRFAQSKGLLPYVVFFVLPGFPDDALCFIAGLTELDLRKLVVVATLGRIPGIYALSLTGSSAATSQSTVFIATSGALIAVSAFSVRFEDEIIEAVHEAEREGLEVMKWLEGFYPRFLSG